MPSRPFVPSLLRTSLAWQGLVLLAVLVVFGAVLHWRTSRAIFARVDTTLADRARVLASGFERDLITGWDLELDEHYLADIADRGWYEVRSPDGKAVRRGGNVPPGASGSTEPIIEGFADRGDTRELAFIGPNRVQVRVGQVVVAERAELRSLLLFTALAGTGVLALALFGGWWLAARTLRPIERMSQTAGSISERDLDRRIDVDSLPAELRDLGTTLNAAFARLEAAFERQARFTADASHEMRTPLSVLRAQAEHALKKERTTAEYREAFEITLRATQRMTRVVEQLLSLARADAGQIEVARAPVDLDLVVRDAVRDTSAEARAARVSVEYVPATLEVPGDGSLLHEVAVNLLSNGIRYNAPGGHVRIALQENDHECTLRVEDDGVGIPENALPHVFERFYRVDPARTRERGGSGLGLAITRWIVEAHGGSIMVQSRLGQGSTFTVRLPRNGSGPSGTGSGAPPEGIHVPFRRSARS